MGWGEGSQHPPAPRACCDWPQRLIERTAWSPENAEPKPLSHRERGWGEGSQHPPAPRACCDWPQRLIERTACSPANAEPKPLSHREMGWGEGRSTRQLHEHVATAAACGVFAPSTDIQSARLDSPSTVCCPACRRLTIRFASSRIVSRCSQLGPSSLPELKSGASRRLPPPLAGEGWGGGNGCRKRPHPDLPPQAGEGVACQRFGVFGTRRRTSLVRPSRERWIASPDSVYSRPKLRPPCAGAGTDDQAPRRDRHALRIMTPGHVISANGSARHDPPHAADRLS